MRMRENENQNNNDNASVDDQFRALMEGLRTTLPGVQVLFGFLLVLPLYASFAELETSQLWAYYIAFASATLSSLLLIAPSVHQRVRSTHDGIPRRHLQHVLVAVRLTVVGSIALLVSITAVVYLVTEIVLQTTWAVVAVAVTLAVGLWSWIYMPLVSFTRNAKRPDRAAPPRTRIQ